LIAGAAAVLGGIIWDEERIKKHNLEHPEDPIETPSAMMKRMWEGGKSFLGRNFGDVPLADTTMDDTKRGFLNTLSMPESGGEYNIKNGMTKFSDFSQFPEGVGPGGTSTASGRYQFTSETWKDLQKKYPGQFNDFSPVTQDRGAWAKASDSYRENTGRDLYSDLKSGNQAANIAQGLKGIWPSLPGGSQSTQSLDAFATALQKGTGASSGGTPDAHYSPIMGAPGAFDPALSNLLRTPTAAAMIANDHSRSVNQSSEVHVGAVHVHVANGNPDSIARGVGASLRKYAYVNTMNSGLT
jgi:muramidase (phage lysozyme)